jgi:hypothetical protein
MLGDIRDQTIEEFINVRSQSRADIWRRCLEFRLRAQVAQGEKTRGLAPTCRPP